MVATQLVGFAVMLAIVIALSLVYLPDSRATVWLSCRSRCVIVGFVAGSLARGGVAERDLPGRRAHRRGPAAAVVLPDAGALLARRDPRRGASTRGSSTSSTGAIPLTPAVESFRDPLFFGELPAAGDVVYLVVATVVSLALGALVFSRVDDRVAVEV